MLDTIIRHARDVMAGLGKGHREHVYGKALEVSFGQAMVHYRSEVCCPVLYRGEIVGHGRADFIVGNFVIEIKASRLPVTRATDQLLKYLESLYVVERRTYCGVILNFNQHTGAVDVLKHDPVVRSRFFAKPAARRLLH
jgi:GxxExxY protein